jgi:hypothetical protein
MEVSGLFTHTGNFIPRKWDSRFCAFVGPNTGLDVIWKEKFVRLPRRENFAPNLYLFVVLTELSHTLLRSWLYCFMINYTLYNSITCVSLCVSVYWPIIVVARSKAWTVFTRSNAGILGSSLTQGMGFCVLLFCDCVVLYADSDLATGWSPVQGILSTVYRIKEVKSCQGPTKDCRAIDR